MNYKRLYELPFINIDLRDFYQYYQEEDNDWQKKWWSDVWYCWKDCCWEIEELIKETPSLKIRKVPLSKKIRWFDRERFIYISLLLIMFILLIIK